MKKDEKTKELHCFPFGGGSYGGRPKLPIDVEMKPVYGRTTVFSMPHACLAAGLIGEEVAKEQILNPQVLGDLVSLKWDRSVERFLDDARGVGVNEEGLVETAGAFRGAIIGWTWEKSAISRANAEQWGICPDLALTLTILSRRIGDIFISARDPDFSWDTLFGTFFEVDEDLGPAPDLLSEPWNRFRWW